MTPALVRVGQALQHLDCYVELALERKRLAHAISELRSRPSTNSMAMNSCESIRPDRRS